jgi:hypothetical protein
MITKAMKAAPRPGRTPPRMRLDVLLVIVRR